MVGISDRNKKKLNKSSEYDTEFIQCKADENLQTIALDLTRAF